LPDGRRDLAALLEVLQLVIAHVHDQARTEGERRPRVRDEVVFDLVVLQPLAVRRDVAQHVVVSAAARADAHDLRLLNLRAADGRGRDQLVVIADEQHSLGGRPEHRAADLPADRQRREHRVERQHLLLDDLFALFGPNVGVLGRRVEIERRGDLVGGQERHVVGRRLLGGLGDQLALDGRGGFLERRNALQLDLVAHRELEDAVRRAHAGPLVHVELLDDPRVLKQAGLVGRDELGHLLGAGRRQDFDRLHGDPRHRQQALHHVLAARVERGEGADCTRVEVGGEGALQDGAGQGGERRAGLLGGRVVGRFGQRGDDGDHVLRPEAGDDALGRHGPDRRRGSGIEHLSCRRGEALEIDRGVHRVSSIGRGAVAGAAPDGYLARSAVRSGDFSGGRVC
jgi:hypothetical protein